LPYAADLRHQLPQLIWPAFFIFIAIVIVIVHPLFKRNIYLSLYVIGFSFFLQILFFSFF
jgi:hypothetical protein